MIYEKQWIYILYLLRFESKNFTSAVLKKNEFNTTVLWFWFSLLSISRSPLLCFCFQVLSSET
jgi:hypothetical protein